MKKSLAILACLLFLAALVQIACAAAANPPPNFERHRTVDPPPVYKPGAVPLLDEAPVPTPVTDAPVIRDDPDAEPGDVEEDETQTPVVSTPPPEETPNKKGLISGAILGILIAIIVIVAGGYFGLTMMKKMKAEKERDF